jgi:hypothetical protein
MKRNHWEHYKVHRQPVTGHGSVDWSSYHWQVTRPSNHPLMQGDNWELHAHKQFSSFEHAMNWASYEATKDKVRALIDEFTEDEDNLYFIAAIAARVRMFLP